MAYLIWPEKQIVSDDWIETYFADAVANSYIAPERLGAATVIAKARALQDAGLITLGNEPKRPKPNLTDREVIDGAKALELRLHRVITTEDETPAHDGLIMLAATSFFAHVIMDEMRDSQDRIAIGERAKLAADHVVSMVSDLIDDKFDD